MKNTTIVVIALIVLVVIGIGGYFLTQNMSYTADPSEEVVLEPNTVSTTTADTNDLEEEEPIDETQTVLGNSVENRPVTAYHYGNGDTELLFVGGIHGGYSWNTALVAYELMDYLEANPNVIPDNVKVTVIPVMNPDGLYKVVSTEGRFTASDVSTTASVLTSGRFNGRNVDLNRNFDCDWSASGVWQNRTVSGGASVFSEPESQAVRNYIEARNIAAAVVWYSAAGGVYSSSCHNGVLTETNALTNLYAQAAGYSAHAEFDFYEITGDMVNWMAGEEIPAISVLLTNHQSTEWTKNKAGVEALLQYYSE